MASTRTDDPPPRLRAPPFVLLARTAGTPREITAKLARLIALMARFADVRALDRRLRRLLERGHIPSIPTRVQLAVGAWDMLRFFIAPAAAQYYRLRGIDFRFHQLLRLLEEPASLGDPIGLFSTRDAIIGHLMQVVHANPVYDLQLLDMFDDGLDELESQLDAMIVGAHPRAQGIGAIVEERDYHARLREFVRAWRRDPTIAPMLRANFVESARFRDEERTFGTMDTAFAYFAKLPTTLPAAARHMMDVRDWPTAARALR